MAQEIRLPKLDMTMKQATIVAWLKKEGEAVRRGEPLLQVETEKAVLEVESPADGVVSKIVAKEGSKVPVDSLIAILA
ncbi:MAG: biotin attachment protein [Chloroflexi bacterium]|nr:biotin attachment protein [Chloroflexota bacterium]